MFHRLPLISAAILIVSLGCTSNPDAKPVWVEATGSNIPARSTFGWEGGATPPATILDNQIRDALRSGLIAKGYVESTDSPEILIDHETVERDAIKQGNPVRLGIGVGSWGGNVGGSVGTSVDVGEKDELVQQLRISIRALDPGEGSEIWVGTTGALSERPDAASVTAAVAAVMAGFPDRAAGTDP